MNFPSYFLFKLLHLLEFLKSKNSVKINKLLHSYLFNQNSISKDQQPVYPAEGMHVVTKAGREKMLGWAEEQAKKAAPSSQSHLQ